MKFSLSKLYASSPQEDRILWRDFKNGSEEALEHIFKTYYPLLYDYGIRLIGDIEMVKDGIQDLFCLPLGKTGKPWGCQIHQSISHGFIQAAASFQEGRL